MSRRQTWGERLVLWWVAQYTRTAPVPDGPDRRAEIRADLHDQVTAADGAATASRAVAVRTVRGLHHDLAWRAAVERRPGRLRWHLEHPSTALAVLLLLLVPTALAVDVGASRSGWSAVSALAGPVLVLLCATTIGFAVTAVTYVVRRPRPRWPPRADALRRAATAAMSVTWAVAAVWRFSPGLDGVAAVAWAGFGLSLVGYLATTLSGLVRWLAFGKVSS